MRNTTSVTLLFFCMLFAFTAKAQNLFQFPFMRTEAQPELFVYDPHYDPQHRITQYTYGNFMRIIYTPDKQGRPLKKEVFLWNRDRLNSHIDTYRWEKSSETVYTYHNDLLVEERTLQPRRYLGGYYVFMPTRVKTITHDPLSRTDTLVTAMDIPFSYTFGQVRDTSTTVTYYNKNHHPDSIVTWRDFPTGRKFWKEVFHYDKKNRPVRIGNFIRDSIPAWQLQHETEIAYARKGITYTQKIFCDMKDILYPYINA